MNIDAIAFGNVVQQSRLQPLLANCWRPTYKRCTKRMRTCPSLRHIELDTMLQNMRYACPIRLPSSGRASVGATPSASARTTNNALGHADARATSACGPSHTNTCKVWATYGGMLLNLCFIKVEVHMQVAQSCMERRLVGLPLKTGPLLRKTCVQCP